MMAASEDDLTPKEVEALARAREHGSLIKFGPEVGWSKQYWTFPQSLTRVPAWWCGTRVITWLVERGLLGYAPTTRLQRDRYSRVVPVAPSQGEQARFGVPRPQASKHAQPQRTIEFDPVEETDGLAGGFEHGH